jgi:hypothetical protein
MILQIVGCYVTGPFLPGLLPALVAFVFFITLWPNGDMLTSHAGDSDDPEIHESSRRRGRAGTAMFWHRGIRHADARSSR